MRQISRLGTSQHPITPNTPLPHRSSSLGALSCNRAEFEFLNSLNSCNSLNS